MSSPSPSSSSSSSMLAASRDGNVAKLTKLMKKTTAEGLSALTEEKSGYSCLMLAAKGSHIGCMKVLLDANADMNASSAKDGHNPLSVAAMSSNPRGSVPLLREALWSAGLGGDRAVRKEVYAAVLAKTPEGDVVDFKSATAAMGTETAATDKKFKQEQGSLARDIELALEPSFFVYEEMNTDPEFLNKDIYALLRAYHTSHKLTEYVEGSAQMCVRLMLIMDNDLDASFRLLQLIYKALHKYNANDQRLARDVSVMVCDLIVTLMPAVANHFNATEFTLVDMCDVFCMWMRPCFATHFKFPVFSRLMDIVLLDPSPTIARDSGLFGFFLGCVFTFKGELASMPSQQIYQFVTDIPLRLAGGKVDTVFDSGYTYFAAKPDVLEQISQTSTSDRSWSNVIEYSGQLMFGVVPSTEYSDEEEEDDEQEQEQEQEQELEAKHAHHPTKSSLKGGSTHNPADLKGVRADVIPSKSRRKEQELEVKLAEATKQLEHQRRQLERMQDGHTQSSCKPSRRRASVHFKDGVVPGDEAARSIQKPVRDCPPNGLIRFSELVSSDSACSVVKCSAVSCLVITSIVCDIL
jgi:hypothetical protein